VAAGVWRHRRFRLFWTGDTISAAGGALSTVAVPLLAVQTLDASDTALGVVRAAQTLPFLLLAVPIGLLADRVSRRRLLLTADAVRFPLAGVIAVLGAALTVGGLVALVFAIGVCTVAYEVAYLSVLPDLVDGPAELPPANRAVETAHAGASLLGPGVGGALVAALAPAGVVALDAVSFAVGATLTMVNRWERTPPDTGSPRPAAPVRGAPGPPARRPAPGPAPRPAAGSEPAASRPAAGVSGPDDLGSMWPPGARPAAGVPDLSDPGATWPSAPDPAGPGPTPGDPTAPATGELRTARRRAGPALAAGWVWLWGDPFVRPMTLYLAANNVATQAFQTALLLFVLHTLGLSAAAVGFAVAASGGGFLAGAAVSPAAARRLGAGRVITAAALLGALGIATVATAPDEGGFAVVLLGAALSGAGPGMLNLHSISIRQAITPPTVLGRVNAVVKTISYGATTLGALIGGVAAGAFGPRAVIAAAAVASVAAALILATSLVRRRRN
jgi:MFS family permease